MPVDTALPTKKTRTTLFAENCESCALFKEGGCEFSGPCTGGGMEMDEGMEMGRPKGIDGCPRFSGQEFGEEDPVINSLRNILTRKTFKDFHLASASLHGTKISSTLDIVKDAQKTVEETNQDLKEWKSKFTVANRGFRNQEKRFKDLSRKLSTTHSSGMSATARKAQQKRLDVIRNKRDKFSEEADMAEDRIKEFRNELQADKEHLKSAIKVFKMLVKNEIKKRTQNKNFSQDMDSGQEFGRPKGSRNRPLKARRTAKLESILNSLRRLGKRVDKWDDERTRLELRGIDLHKKNPKDPRLEALNRKERIAARNVNRLINEFVNRYEKIFGHLDQVGDPVSETYPLTRTTEQIRRDHPIVEDSIGFSDEDQQDMDFGEGMELADGLPSLPKLSSKDSPKVKTLRQIKQLKSEQKSLQKKRQSMPHGPGFSEDYGMRFVRNDPRAKRIGLRRAWPMIQKLAQKWLDLYREIQYLRRKDWPNIDAKEKNFRRQKALFRSLKNVDRMLKQRLEKYDAWDSAFDKVEEIAEGSIKPKDLQEFSEDYGMGFRFSESPDCLTCQEYQDTCQGMDFVGLQGCVRGGKILDTPKCRGRKAVQRELAKRGEGPVEKEGVEVVRTKESKTQAAPTLLEHKFQPERIEKRIPVVQKEQKVLKANLGKIGAIKQEASNDLGFWRGRHEAAKKMLEKIKSAPQVDENLLGKWERLQGGYEDELNFAKERIKISEKIQGSIEELFQFNQEEIQALSSDMKTYKRMKSRGINFSESLSESAKKPTLRIAEGSIKPKDLQEFSEDFGMEMGRPKGSKNISQFSLTNRRITKMRELAKAAKILFDKNQDFFEQINVIPRSGFKSQIAADRAGKQRDAIKKRMDKISIRLHALNSKFDTIHQRLFGVEPVTNKPIWRLKVLEKSDDKIEAMIQKRKGFSEDFGMEMGRPKGSRNRPLEARKTAEPISETYPLTVSAEEIRRDSPIVDERMGFSESPDCLTCQEYQDTCQGMDFVGLQGCVRGGKILDTPKCRGRKAVQRELAKRGEGPVAVDKGAVISKAKGGGVAAPTDKAGFLDFIQQKTGASPERANNAYRALIEGFQKGLRVNGRIRLSELGTFVVKKMKARDARNPRTGEKIRVLAKIKLGFRPSKSLEESLTATAKELKPRRVRGKAEKIPRLRGVAAANKKEFLDFLRTSQNVTPKIARQAYDTLINGIRRGITEGGQMDIPELGRFIVKRVKARDGRNPQTGERIRIPSKLTVKFKSAKQEVFSPRPGKPRRTTEDIL